VSNTSYLTRLTVTLVCINIFLSLSSWHSINKSSLSRHTSLAGQTSFVAIIRNTSASSFQNWFILLKINLLLELSQSDVECGYFSSNYFIPVSLTIKYSCRLFVFRKSAQIPVNCIWTTGCRVVFFALVSVCELLRENRRFYFCILCFSI
jgi:hypothetical protein